jgi:hypothetical protein
VGFCTDGFAFGFYCIGYGELSGCEGGACQSDKESPDGVRLLREVIIIIIRLLYEILRKFRIFYLLLLQNP